MRVITGLVLAGWLLGGVAAPCLVRDTCASTARHECCCDSADQCCCRLTSRGAPASASHVATVTTTPDLLGQPAAEAVALPGVDATSHRDAILATHPTVAQPPPLYVSTCAFRC